MSAQNKAIVEKINDTFRQNSIDGFLAYCDDDVEWTMVGEKTVKGKENIRSWMNSMHPPEPPKFDVARMIAEDDMVAAYGEMTMDENDQKDVPYSYCDVYRLRNGKIAELRSYVVKLATAEKAKAAGA